MTKAKGFMDFISEDGSLTEKMTYEDFENKKSAPSNSDDNIKDAYEAYLNVMKKLNA